MTTQTAIQHSSQYSLKSSMDSPHDKEERKREYNRLAQREFRRRRKEHLKNLEQAQKEQSSEQSEEIERLRYQNDELRRENETLRAQIYGSSSTSSSHNLMPASMNVPLANDGRSFSLSPSISGTSISGAGSPRAKMGSDIMPMAALSLTSSMLPPNMHAYADPSALSTQPYSMVHPSGLHHNSQSSPESSGFRSSRSAVGSSFQSLNVTQPVDAQNLQVPCPQRSRARSSSLSMTPYDRSIARTDLRERFRPLLADLSVTATTESHLSILRAMSDSLPDPLKPTKAQLETPHYYGIDLLASPSLRDRLLTVTIDVAQSFVAEIGILGNEHDGALTIWGDDPLDELSWEFSQATLERWGWMLGRDWVQHYETMHDDSVGYNDNSIDLA
ncbi:hypothetical protein D0Z07_3748 [Hyphodiscus hymeniophilus]|uniref:BZIP domain-containing protein n=1 Tax=Hyphodiscus hymeniophilus TaxID=353542 RepID=A0A9P6VKL6_9HELO|nr:hypothetical protein D0Z07_3748 [Hyphodiscus hymeniophilus]